MHLHNVKYVKYTEVHLKLILLLKKYFVKIFRKYIIYYYFIYLFILCHIHFLSIFCLKNKEEDLKEKNYFKIFK